MLSRRLFNSIKKSSILSSSSKSSFLFPTFQRNFSNSTDEKRVSILTEITDTPGSLYEFLKYFWKYDVNLTHIESRPTAKDSNGFLVYIDFSGYIGEDKTDKLMVELKNRCRNMLILDEKQVPWFPRHISELDLIANKTCDAGTDLQSDHPGFNDQEYRGRREIIAKAAIDHKWGNPLPIVTYSKEEIETWGVVYNNIKSLHEQFACKEYLKILESMKKTLDFGPHNIPQSRDISNFLEKRTGFRIRPVAGLLSSRDFLNGLAFRTFFSTQYIRHWAKPLYTPEPDVCHELLGHAPMFADPDFADFSQEIGLASLGASDDEIDRLAACYWHSVEFGLVREGSCIKAYGAGLLSSFGEINHACRVTALGHKHTQDSNPDNVISEFKPWEPSLAAVTKFPITTYQPIYFVADSLVDAKKRMREYCENIPKPFYARYNPLTNSVWVDRAIKANNTPI